MFDRTEIFIVFPLILTNSHNITIENITILKQGAQTDYIP